MTTVSAARPARLEAYTTNLREHLEEGGEAPLKRGYELAREAMSDGAGILDLVAMHQSALEAVLKDSFKSEAGLQRLLAADAFFMESLMPYELESRAFLESNLALRSLNERLEEDARRIAHSLNGGASQLLVSACIELQTLSLSVPSHARPHLRRILSLLDRIGDQVNALARTLWPTILDDLGLLPALRALATQVSARTRIPVTVEGELKGRPSQEIETAIYQSVQYGLDDLPNHAGATTVVVRIAEDDGAIVCSVHDDGESPAELSGSSDGNLRRLGLLGARERLVAVHGTLRFDSASGRGSDLTITVPTEI